MRFMILVKANADSEAGVLPGREDFQAMGRVNEEMVRAGVMLAVDGLHPSSKGARISVSGGRRTVTDGPFTETKELIAGFWLIQVGSREEAIEWASRAPFEEAELEIRQVYEASDLPPEIVSPEQAAGEEALRDEVQRQQAARP